MEAENNEKEKAYIDNDFLKEYASISLSVAMKKLKKLEKKCMIMQQI